MTQLADAGVMEVDQRALHDPEDLRQGDLLRRPAKRVTSSSAAAAADQAGSLQLAEDAKQEAQGDVLDVGDVLGVDMFVSMLARELSHRAERVIGLGGNPHVPRRGAYTGPPSSGAWVVCPTARALI